MISLGQIKKPWKKDKKRARWLVVWPLLIFFPQKVLKRALFCYHLAESISPLSLLQTSKKHTPLHLVFCTHTKIEQQLLCNLECVVTKGQNPHPNQLCLLVYFHCQLWNTVKDDPQPQWMAWIHYSTLKGEGGPTHDLWMIPITLSKPIPKAMERKERKTREKNTLL